MKKPGNNKNVFLIIVLFIAIVSMIIFVIIPKFSPLTPDKIIEKIDFSSSTWIEQYAEKSVGLFGKDFFQNTAFSYNKRSNRMVVTYASQKSVEEARNFYLALPGAKQTGRNDEASLNITAEKNGQIIKAYNYYSSVARVFELELILDEVSANKVKNQLEKAFPADEVAKIPEINDLVSGEIFGGYVRYQHDNFDEFSYPYTPIYSRGYIYGGSGEDFNKTIKVLNETYSKNKYDEAQNTYYYQINNQIVSVSFFVTDLNEKVVSVSIQKKKND